MKKIYAKLVAAVLACMMGGTAMAETLYEVNGINYVILNETSVMVYDTKTEPTGDLELPQTVTIEGKTYTLTALDAVSFKDCAKITSVKLPATIDSIGYQAFNGCTALKSINLQDTKLRELQVSTFLSCKSLESIIIPATVVEIGTNPFMETLSLKGITVEEGNPNYVSVDGVLFTKDKKTLISYPVGKSTDYVIPDGTETIATMAFCQGRTVRNVTIPNSVTRIEGSAFMRVDSLQLIKLPENIEFIGSSAFSECKKAKGEIILPNTLKTLQQKAFYYTAITKLEVPGTIKTIPNYLVQYCVQLRSVKLNEGTTAIGDYTFMTCAISEIDIPNTVTKVGSCCFEGSTLLKTITFGEGVQSVGIRAFNNLKSITSVTSKATTPPTISGTTTYPAFTADVYSKAVLRVPKASLAAYKEATNWKDFATIEGFEMAVDKINADEINIEINSDGITVSTPENTTVNVYTTSGLQIYNGQSGEISLPAKGLYIVCVGGNTFKIAY